MMTSMLQPGWLRKYIFPEIDFKESKQFSTLNMFSKLFNVMCPPKWSKNST